MAINLTERYNKMAKKIMDQYEADPNNVPKPTFLSSVALVTLLEDEINQEYEAQYYNGVMDTECKFIETIREVCPEYEDKIVNNTNF